jgi:hypothetical protein
LGLLARVNWLALLAAAPAALLAWQVHLTCGIVYSIDDPYIHLALAKQILRGHYGIHPSEFSAPSSSILWPFLLAPFSFTRIVEFLPLVLNLGAVLATVWWLQRWLAGYMPPAWSLIVTTTLALTLNIYGLALSGMENSWQVAFIVVIAISLLQDRIGWPFWLSVLLLPLVRYEGLAMSLPALAYVWLMPGQRLRAAAVAAVVVGVVVGFSLFLLSLDLGPLPSSVLAKNRILDDPSRAIPVFDNIVNQAFFVALAVASFVLCLQQGRTRMAILLIAVPTLLHLLFGRYGWFARYHIYFVAWTVILFFDVFARTRFYRWPALNALLLAAYVVFSADHVQATVQTAEASRNIHDQQRQMGIILRDHFNEPVAVNDLGFVSLYGRGYVLDLAGLASLEALRAQRYARSADWVAPLMARRKIEHAIIYPEWLGGLPAGWTHVATLHLPHPWVSVASDRVAFYSTNQAAAARFRTALEAYRKTSAQAAMMLVIER